MERLIWLSKIQWSTARQLHGCWGTEYSPPLEGWQAPPDGVVGGVKRRNRVLHLTCGDQGVRVLENFFAPIAVILAKAGIQLFQSFENMDPRYARMTALL